MHNIRSGIGIDVHAFGTGDYLILGGVKVPHTNGIIAHSDGDVLLHALCDALLGAASLGDIGEHFPDNNAEWKDVSSEKLLKICHAMLKKNSWKICNCDCQIMLERPKLQKYKTAISSNIARLLEINNDQINIKATTAERLGFIGRGEGIAAICCCLLSK